MFLLQRLALLGTAGLGGAALYYKSSDEVKKFELLSALGPALRLLDPETTHILGIEAAKWGVFPRETRPDPPILRTTVWHREFPNPIGGCCTVLMSDPTTLLVACNFHMCVCFAGLAAGFDKHAEIIEPLMHLGFGFVEVGRWKSRGSYVVLIDLYWGLM
jgi:dihydroorotate dehydrogenase